MSTSICPDWQSLVASRERISGRMGSGAGELDREWREALEHRISCAPCGRACLTADPLLIFQDMASVELEDTAIEDMQQRVAGALRFVAAENVRKGQLADPKRRARRAWWAGLAAASLFFLLTLGGGLPTALETWGTGDAETRVAENLQSQERLESETKSWLIEQLTRMPPVEAEAEVTLLVHGGSFELVQLGAFGH